MFSSSGEEESEEFSLKMYEEFVPRVEVEEEFENLRIDLKEQIMMEARILIGETASEMIEEQVGHA